MRSFIPRSARLVASSLTALALLSCREAPTAPHAQQFKRLNADGSSITTPTLVISQIYGGGGNSGSTYKNDFIEIFNPGAAAVSLTGWSVQYASAAGTTWQATALAGSIPAGGYYLIQEAAGSGGTTALPTPNATGNIAMATGAGKVVLASQSTAFASGTACPSGATVVDVVSFGTGNCGNPAPGPSSNNTQSAQRAGAGCTYTGNPTNDFTAAVAAPRNSATATNSCSVPANPVVTVLITPDSNGVIVGGTATYVATAKDAGGVATSTTFTWAALSPSVATVSATGVVTGVATGLASITATAANGVADTAIVSVAPSAPVTPHAGEIVISQVYGGGGNANSNYKNDFIELFNRSTQPVTVTGWSVQYASASGAFTQATALTGTIPAGGYYLVQQSAGTGGVTDLPTPEATGTIAMSASAGKILLIQSAGAAGVACPTGNAVVDQVSYGTGTNCGTATPALSATAAALRKSGGCYYTPDVATDFTTGTVAPRNGATAPRSCVVGPLDHVTVTGPAAVLAGSTAQLSAVALDANDNIVTGGSVTWSSSAPTIASVSATGVVSGLTATADPVTITATVVAGAVTKSATATINVNSDGINWIDISSSGTSFPPGFQTQLFATARVQSGGTIIPATFTFEAVDPQYATVQTMSGTGIVTGVAAPSDGSKPGIRVTATPTGGGSPYTFISHPVTIEAPVVASPSIYATNDEFGTPSPATASNADDMLIRRAQYVLSYNQSRGTPNWVSYELDARQMVSGADRCNCFTADPLLPLSKQIFTSDYTNGGFDRGHMTRSADRTITNVENATTFYLTNVVPQYGDLNQGVWAQFENALADSARAGRAVYIITGPLYSRSHGLTYVKNEGKIAIPDSTWKVALIGPGNSGNPFTRANVTTFDDLSGLTLMAVNMPNVTGVRNDPWAMYLTTVEKIEESTGLDLLSLLQTGFQPALDHKDRAPVARFSTSGGTTEGSVITFDASTSTDADIGRTDLGRTESLTFAWHFSDGSNASGAVVTRTASHGNLTATLTVTDAFGWPNAASSTIVVANVAPTASFAAPSSGFEGSAFTVSLNNATDPSPTDAANLRFAFDCGGGYGAPSSSSVASCATNDQGLVTVRGKVIDPDGAFTEYSALVIVANVAPTATFAAPASVDRGSSFALSLNSVLDPSSIDIESGFSFAFDCGDGAGYRAASGLSTLSCATTASGTRTVRATVTDKDGGVNEYSATVSVLSVAPTATFAAAASALEGSAFGLSLSNAVSPVDAASLTFAFDCGAGYGAAGSTPTTSCPTTDQGNITAKGKVIDTEGAFTEYTAVVAVANVAPTATLGAPASVARGSAIALTLSGVLDPSSADVSAGFTFAFDCGDGSGYGAATTTGAASCATTSSGSRTVRAKVSDKDGDSSEYSATVTITSNAPTATFAAPATSALGATFSLALTSPTAATPADLAALTYAFDCGQGYGAPTTSATASCTATTLGGHTVRGKVIDLENAANEYSAVVQVVDRTPPVVTVPANISVLTSYTTGAVVTFSTSAYDAVSGSLTPTCSRLSGSTFALGSTTVTCSATDAAGNVGSAAFSVVVTLDPAIPGDMHGEGKLDVSATVSAEFEFDVKESDRRGEHASLRLNVSTKPARGRETKDEFKMTAVSALQFSDDPAFRPGTRKREPDVDVVEITGAGRWNGRSGYTFTATATDRGEPGKRHDTFAITIRDALGVVVADFSATISEGNIQSARLRGRDRSKDD